MKYINEKISDKVEQFYKTGKIVATNFLDPSEIIMISGEIKYVEHIIWGGFEDAERKVVLIGCEFEENESVNSIASEFISALRINLLSERYFVASKRVRKCSWFRN